MHVSEFLNAKCLVQVAHPVTFVDVLWSLFHCGGTVLDAVGE